MLRINPPVRRCWPPPPHDPRERLVVCRADDWEVRSFPISADSRSGLDRSFAYFAPRSLWHVQLWHPASGVSVLTPSGLTLDHYEIFPIRGWKHWAKDHAHLSGLLDVFHQVAPPSQGMLQAIEEYFVHDPVARFLEAAQDPEEFVAEIKSTRTCFPAPSWPRARSRGSRSCLVARAG
jgi:hypothetical protein